MRNGKSTGLASFAESEPKSEEMKVCVIKGAGDTVGFTVRLKRFQWKRLHEVALEKGCSLQSLCTVALSYLLEKEGLKRL